MAKAKRTREQRRRRRELAAFVARVRSIASPTGRAARVGGAGERREFVGVRYSPIGTAAPVGAARVSVSVREVRKPSAGRFDKNGSRGLRIVAVVANRDRYYAKGDEWRVCWREPYWVLMWGDFARVDKALMQRFVARLGEMGIAEDAIEWF